NNFGGVGLGDTDGDDDVDLDDLNRVRNNFGEDAPATVSARAFDATVGKAATGATQAARQSAAVDLLFTADSMNAEALAGIWSGRLKRQRR
ncbi:MAG: hypothetical protein L0Y72_29515, partial [Gemmataceae bacterium]|nr:hypothetical protein [Gemmataceae bacterium]